MTRVWIGLGANLGDRVATLAAARGALTALAAADLVASPIYETEPWGLADQPRFLNQVVGLDTGLTPLALLDELQRIEREAGRTRTGPRWGPRDLDVDLLCWPELVLTEPRLVLPHPRMAERRFVLAPLAGVAPDLQVPGLGATVSELLAGCPDRCEVKRLS